MLKLQKIFLSINLNPGSYIKEVIKHSAKGMILKKRQLMHNVKLLFKKIVSSYPPPFNLIGRNDTSLLF